MKYLLAVFIVVLLFGCTQQQPVVDDNSGGQDIIVGNDTDAHGCIGSAGYSWCEAKQKCLRVWEEPCNSMPALGCNAMTEEEALDIARNSVCGDNFKCSCPQGYVLDNDVCNPDCYYATPQCSAPSIQCGEFLICNENSQTYWIDLNIEKEGCNPACVIYTENKTAEINWRCTGLL
jgi:hypothetical protein